MPSIKDLKKRIVSVKNTQQTTKAMKMVSAAKLRRAQDAILSQRPYSRQVEGLIRKLLPFASEDLRQGFAQSHRDLSGAEGVEPRTKTLLVLVTSDRGLCGGFNSSVIKAALRWRAQKGAETQVQMAYVGRKGNEFFKNKAGYSGIYFEEITGKVSFAHAQMLSKELMKRFLEGEYDEIKIVYNEFKNAISQRVVVEDFLPLQSGEPALEEAESMSAIPAENYLVKPSAKEVLDRLLEKHFSIQAYRILLESQAGEHGARMSAMENATKNAGEMIRKLTLLYNKQRQASITKELLEIISGSESQKSASA